MRRSYGTTAGAVWLALATLGLAGGGTYSVYAEEALSNPLLDDAQAIAEGRRLYRSRCIICHRNRGGRGPNLFDTALSDEQFLETVVNGRKGSSMPAFGYRMSPDDVWMVHAFVKSTGRY